MPTNTARHSAFPLAPRELSEDDVWALVELCPWRGHGRRLTIARNDFFIRLGRLDSQRRALVAMILADALSDSPGRGDLGGLEEELRQLLRRERDHLWPAELAVVNRKVGETDADVAIAFATMVDGLGPPELQEIDAKRGTRLDRRILPACAQAIGKPFKDRPVLGRLEPDLIGEFFVLETLHDKDNPFAEPPNSWMPESAWRTRGSAMMDFTIRSTQNFPDHPSIKRIAITVSEVTESWWVAAFLVASQSTDFAQGSMAALKMLYASAKSDLGAAHALAVWTVSNRFQLRPPFRLQG